MLILSRKIDEKIKIGNDITITEELINKKAEPLKDFDGPVYLRASEAELKLNATIS